MHWGRGREPAGGEPRGLGIGLDTREAEGSRKKKKNKLSPQVARATVCVKRSYDGVACLSNGPSPLPGVILPATQPAHVPGNCTVCQLLRGLCGARPGPAHSPLPSAWHM